jgi:hypothetical protein
LSILNYVCPQAEVRGFQHDGLHLQARSQKYGKVCILGNLLKHFLLIELLIVVYKKKMIVGYITVASQRQYKMETLNDMGIAAYKYKTERIRTTCL